MNEASKTQEKIDQVEEFLIHNNIEGKSQKTKAVALLSGGLDSAIATKLIKDKGIEITALNFHTAFCNCTSHGCKFESRQVSKEMEIPLKVLSVTKEYMDVVRNPKFGYGSEMNPCIDCRIFMFKKAKEYMEEIDASFVITGEVLGQRPMSQNRRSMNLIEKESGLDGKILRPLSAGKEQNLSQEVKNQIDLTDLPNITGRSRKEQYALVDDLSIENFSCPSGGCLLTDKEFANRLKDHFKHNDKDDINEIKLLKIGRHFRLNENSKLIVARNEAECKKLSFYKHIGLFFEPDYLGANALLLSKNPQTNDIELSAKIITRYCKGEEEIKLHYSSSDEKKSISVKPFHHDETVSYRI